MTATTEREKRVAAGDPTGLTTGAGSPAYAVVRARRGPLPGPAVRRRRTRVAWLAGTLGLCVIAALLSVGLGARGVSLAELLAGLAGAQGSLGEAAVAARVPRTVLALLVGGALGLAGAVMQGVTRNPLADPGILGVTSGAALAVVVGIAFFSLASPGAYVWVAILGAALAAAFVYAVGSLGRGGATPLRLTLAGAATAAAASCLTAAILLPRIEVMAVFRFWQVGGVGGADATDLALLAPFVVAGGLLCLATTRGLDALALGDDQAAGLGQRVGLVRLVAATGAVVLCGAATAVAGPIAFVGLVAPHLARLGVGHDHRWLLPASVLVGAAMLTLADVAGRVVARPEELDVGVVVAFVGGPVFLWLVRRTGVRAL